MLNEKRLLRDYVAYYNAESVLTYLRDAPAGRPTESRPSPDAQVVGLARVGGRHHRYVWRMRRSDWTPTTRNDRKWRRTDSDNPQAPPPASLQAHALARTHHAPMMLTLAEGVNE